MRKTTTGRKAACQPSEVLAEGVGFEPTIRYNRIPDFESGAFDLSATLPKHGIVVASGPQFSKLPRNKETNRRSYFA